MGKNRKSDQSGTLYVVATPVGNLEDITLRAVRILKDVDLIAAEGVRHTKGLCRHYDIRTRIIGYNQHNRKTRIPELLGKLRSGRNVALVTNAGTPGISDPGEALVNRVLEENLPVSPIPGPSAAIGALCVSGMPSNRFVFVGFLSSRRGKRRKELQALAGEMRTMVLFEAPHRLKQTLEDILDILGDREVAVAREMTKVYEEVLRGPAGSLLKNMDPDGIKGELTLVVAGGTESPKPLHEEAGIRNQIEKALMDADTGARDLAQRLAAETGIPFRRLYRLCLEVKRKKHGS